MVNHFKAIIDHLDEGIKDCNLLKKGMKRLSLCTALFKSNGL
ncbi:hypothetical protein F3D3_0183 [Fusibacter sp. 3D3]|nr:hypothetical protein F3D3_0183 [Fusibacter sp. 3D3]